MKTTALIPRRNQSLPIVSLVLATTAFALAAANPAMSLTGRNLEDWRRTNGWITARAVSLNPADAKKLLVEPGTGLIVNAGPGRPENLLSKEEFGDVEAHLEFCVPEKSNSGIYFMGRYEIQVYDSHGVEKDKYPGIECGGIYPRWTKERGEFEGRSPRVNASKPPGEWQTFDVVFRAPRFDASGRKVENARFVQVMHNGVLVHQNVVLTGPTRAAAFEDEKSQGPLMLQGDHGPVAYRNVRIKRLE